MKQVLILGEEDGWFRYHPPLCENSPPEWFLCLTEDQEDVLRGVLREWKQRGIPVVLRLTWAPGDSDVCCTTLPAATGKPYRLLHAGVNDYAVAQAPFAFSFNVKDYLFWLVSEDWPEEEDAVCDELAQRFKRGELTRDKVEQFLQVLHELRDEQTASLNQLKKIIHKSNFRVVQ